MIPPDSPSLLEYDGLRLCRYWDTEILGLLREIVVITDTERYWDTGVNWAFAKKRGYLDTEILSFWRDKILRYWAFGETRYWDTELLHRQDTEILSFWREKILRYWAARPGKNTEILSFWKENTEILSFRENTEILSFSDRKRYWDTELRRQRKILTYWGMPVSLRKMITNKMVTIYLETEQELEAHIQQFCSAIKIK